MPTILSLIDDVRPQIPAGVLDETYSWAILQAARKFCVESYYLRETQVLSVNANQRYYELAAEMAETEIVAFKALQYGQYPLDPTSFEDVPQESGDPVAWITDLPAIVWLTPTPTIDITDALAVRCILQPSRTAANLPEDLRRYLDAITEGALAWVYRMGGTSWANRQLAEQYEREFEHRIRAARHDADTTHRPRNVRTKPVDWSN